MQLFLIRKIALKIIFLVNLYVNYLRNEFFLKIFLDISGG